MMFYILGPGYSRYSLFSCFRVRVDVCLFSSLSISWCYALVLDYVISSDHLNLFL